VNKTRHFKDIEIGASPRGSLAIMAAAKAIAVIKGRDFVTPDDIQYVVDPVLAHRITIAPEREMEGNRVKLNIYKSTYLTNRFFTALIVVIIMYVIGHSVWFYQCFFVYTSWTNTAAIQFCK